MKKKVAVIMGGPSSEKKISLESGNAVYKALLNSKRYTPKKIIIDDQIGSKDLENIDTVFLALHGKFGEDGKIQKIIERRGVPYTGSNPISSKAAFDKSESKKIFINNIISTPPYLIYNKTNFKEAQEKLGSKLLVIKPIREGSSFGISIVNSPSEFNRGIIKAQRYDSRLLIEKYVDGREFTVGIVGKNILPVVEIIPKKRKFFDYTAKYNPGFSDEIVPAKIPKPLEQKLKKTALEVFNALKLRHFARIDMKMDQQNRIYVFEANSLPGMTPNSLIPKAAKAYGMSFLSFVEAILDQT